MVIDERVKFSEAWRPARAQGGKSSRQSGTRKLNMRARCSGLAVIISRIKLSGYAPLVPAALDGPPTVRENTASRSTPSGVAVMGCLTCIRTPAGGIIFVGPRSNFGARVGQGPGLCGRRTPNKVLTGLWCQNSCPASSGCPPEIVRGVVVSSVTVSVMVRPWRVIEETRAPPGNSPPKFVEEASIR